MFTRIARFSVRRRRLVVTAWMLILVVGLAAGAQLFMRLKDTNGGSGTESARGAAVLEHAQHMGPMATVLVSGAPVDAPSTRAAVQTLADRLERVPDVTRVVDAYSSPDPMLRGKDGSSSLVLVILSKNADMMGQRMAVSAMRQAAHDSVPGATVQVGGDVAQMSDSMAASKHDLYHGELLSLPVLLIALFFIFGGLRAALLPLIASVTASAGTLLPLLGVTYATDLSPYAVDVVMLFGLGLAVDYSLLMVNRFREARADGLDVGAAVERTVTTAGRTVLFSALTIAASLSGLFVFGDPTFTSVAVSGIATVLIALAAALSLVPALIASWGARLGSSPRREASEGRFGRLAQRVQRRPVLAAVGVTAVLAAAAVPFLHVSFSNGDVRTLPASAESRQVAEHLLAEFPGAQADPIQVVAHVRAGDPRLSSYVHEVRGLPGVESATPEALEGGVSVVNVVPVGATQGSNAKHLVTELREHRPAFETEVTGQAASLVDFEHVIVSRAPYAALLIALATFTLLFLMTGSVLVPVKALVMNVLSLGATFGALVWIFQDGHLSGALHFTPFGSVEAWLPVIVFVFAFGLSMDYEVFLLSRIKESYDETGDTDTAVANGLQRSGRIITAAASLILVVFLGFAAGESLGIKEMGVALSVAVAVDATLVRCVLVPATMTLLGKANWWAPEWMRRVHDRFGLSEGEPGTSAVTNPGDGPSDAPELVGAEAA
jgi:putative drug exporter of the RND superfamily